MALGSDEIQTVIGAKQQPVILEIGSHTGEDTQAFLSCYPDAAVFCFEPDPRCCQLWRNHSFGRNTQLFEIALSDRDEKICLNLSEAVYPKSESYIRRLLRKLTGRSTEIVVPSLGQSSIISPASRTADYPWLQFKNKVEITALRLDTWRRQYAPEIRLIDFIWTDVQGAERRLVEGGVQTLAITRYMTVEYGENGVYAEALNRRQTIQLMLRHSFRLVDDMSDIGPKGNLLFKNEGLAASLP